jgi:hypothetical protein
MNTVTLYCEGLTMLINKCMIVKRGVIIMGDYLFWIILIPVLFYLIAGFFTKESHPEDMEIPVFEDEYGDE